MALIFLNDNETQVDLLNYEAIAKTVVKRVRQTPETPITIGIHGDWGAGKSSVLAMTEAALSAEECIVCLRFNGWLFQGFEDAKIVLIESIINELRRKRPASAKVAECVKSLLRRVDWLKVAKKAGGFLWTATTGIPTFDQLKGIFNNLGALVSRTKNTISAEDIAATVEQVEPFVKVAEPSNVPEEIREFRADFEKLLQAAEIEQLVVLIDDLDRCLPDTAIETLEAIRLFLFVPRTAFIIAADEAMIEYAVKKHFPDLPLTSGPLTYTRNYLEKLIQVPFRIPVLGVAETRIYVTLLLIQSELGEEHPSFQKLLLAARERLARPWENQKLDREAVRKALALDTLPPTIEQGLRLSEQMTPILTDGTKGNPRQVKRFLNSMMLRYAIAEARGFAQAILQPVLAKLMLAERFAPDFYDQLARLVAISPDGIARDLAVLEEAVESAYASPKGGKKHKSKAETESTITEHEWLKSEWIRSWVALDPPLKDVDLRPYIFVTRDKRNYFSAASTFSHLETLVDRLLGPPLSIRSIESEVAKLNATEAEQIFEALRQRVLQADDLQQQPKGIDGLAALVKVHPTLQRALIELIRSLPVEQLGPWTAAGWSSCLTDPAAAAAFQELLGEWEEQTENQALRVAVRAARKVMQTQRI